MNTIANVEYIIASYAFTGFAVLSYIFYTLIRNARCLKQIETLQSESDHA